MNRIRSLLVLAVLALVVAAAGCGDDDPMPPPGDADLPYPDTAVQVLHNFVTACEKANIAYYQETLDPDFRLYLEQNAIDLYALPRVFFDYDEDLLSTGRIFSGNTYTRDYGDVVPGITGIQFDVFEAEDIWRMSPPEHRIPDTMWAPFQVQMVVEQGNVGRMNIEGRMNIFVSAAVDSTQGQTRTRYAIVAIEDFTSTPAAKGGEFASWSMLKAMFR